MFIRIDSPFNGYGSSSPIGVVGATVVTASVIGGGVGVGDTSTPPDVVRLATVELESRLVSDDTSTTVEDDVVRVVDTAVLVGVMTAVASGSLSVADVTVIEREGVALDWLITDVCVVETELEVGVTLDWLVDDV